MEILVNPTKHGVSVCSHLFLSILVSVSWICNSNKKITTNLSIHPRKQHFLSAVFSFLLLNLFICGLNYYLDDDLAAQFDLVVTTLVWVLILVYLYSQQNSEEEEEEFKPPIFLRIWWLFFSLMSSSFLVLDILLYWRRYNCHQILPMVQDFISVGVGFYLCFLVFLVGYNKSDTSTSLMHEPLLGTNVNKEEEEKSSPFSTSNFFGILTFSWLNPLLALGNQKQISVDDVPLLPFDDSAQGIFPVFTDKLLSGDGNISSLSLSMALLFSTLGDIACTALLSIINIAASLVGPYFISSFVQYLDESQKFKSRGYMLVSAFILSKVVQSLSQRHTSFKLEQVGIRIHEALVATIYKKLLTLSTQSRRVYSCGEVVNFISIDAEKVSNFSLYLHDWWRVPLQVISALAILYMNLGVASALTFIATALILWGIVPVHKLQKTLQKKLMDSKDGRMKATTEVLKNMKILKLYGWEMKFLSKIFTLRENEEVWLKKYVYIRILSTVIFFVSPTIVAAVTFGACVVMGIPLVSGKVLSAIAIFGMLKEAMFDFPYSISVLAQARVSIGRISSFLCLSDLEDDIVVKLPITSNVAIEVENGNFSWDLSSCSFMMKELNFRVIRGMRVGVCGTVGSGKSSLLLSVLGEMIKLSGDVRVCGKKAYVSQSPWIQSGKVEENILFGKEMNRERYERVLEVCCLKKDLEVFPFGDQTIIGERGINLSGGQKQRIQIARAIYQDADTYLFDDPFSALDAHTGMHLYKECLLNFLHSKTVLYVTNQVEFLPSADLILVLKDGTIAQSGSYNEILKPGTYFSDLVGIHQKALLVHKDSVVETEGLAITNGKKHCPEIGVAEEENKGLCQITNNIYEILENQEQLVKEEEREQGRVGAHVYWDYITTYKGALVPVLLVVVLILSNLLQIGSDYWMAWDTPVSKDTKSNVEASTLIIVYMSLAFGSCFFVFVRAVITGTAGYKTATMLFKRMHLCIFRAPMSFFDSTPSGRILNRASTDQGEIDYDIPAIMGGFAANTIKLLGVISIMAFGAWQVCLIYVPVVVACIFYQQYHTAAARELARLTGVCDAPVQQHFTESISGMTTIKSFDQESRFMSTNMKLIDSSLQPKFYSTGANEWLGFRLDVLSSFTFALTLIFLVSMPGGVIDPGIAGLAVTYGLNLNTLQAFVIWLFGILESDIIAVERILQYTRIPNEAPLVIDTHRPDSKWPLHGEVSIHNLEVRYAPNLPLILRGVTCTFPGEMKTGIVGRTGSGKSTLIQTLFRIMEASSGRILIDGVDISNIGLHDLRSKLSIIPQDPTMFEGTVRSNLDPLEEYTDNQIWEALDKCQLGDEIRKKEQKLDSPVMENGENWSMGQRQLVCLGRVVLKKSKILVLDEATSSVDTATDALMQKTLRHHFSDSTVITIAHRITSVLDSDMVLVMENGKVLEYDSPNKLLGKKSSSFAKLVAEHVGASTN